MAVAVVENNLKQNEGPNPAMGRNSGFHWMLSSPSSHCFLAEKGEEAEPVSRINRPGLHCTEGGGPNQ